NRMTEVTDPSGGVTRYHYGPAGNLIRTELPNSVVETRGYDSRNRLISIHDAGSQGVLADFQYTLGPTGLRTSVTEGSGRQLDYSYDADYRLVRESFSDSVEGNREISYSYDSVGNRLSRDDSAMGITSYDYDANDRLVSERLAGAVTTY